MNTSKDEKIVAYCCNSQVSDKIYHLYNHQSNLQGLRQSSLDVIKSVGYTLCHVCKKKEEANQFHAGLEPVLNELKKLNFPKGTIVAVSWNRPSTRQPIKIWSKEWK